MHEKVRYAATLPGRNGTDVAFLAELVISFLMMTVVLNVSNTPKIARFTGSHRRRVGRDLYHARIPVVGYEHEPGAQLCVRTAGTVMESAYGCISPRRRSGCCWRQKFTRACAGRAQSAARSCTTTTIRDAFSAATTSFRQYHSHSRRRFK